MNSQNNNPDLSELIPLTYSMLINNIDINKQKNVRSNYSFLNLEKLVNEFSLDNSFISKSYYQSEPEFSYNEPPKGPIELFFECIYCGQVGPDNHLNNCKRPFNSSLYLTAEGTRKYTSYEEGTPYVMAVSKRGQKKVISTSIKSDKFQDSVEIIYSDVNKRETVIRIAKNGSINIISAGFGNKKLPNEIIDKINRTSALNLQEYKKVYPNKNKMDIEPNITYKYLLFAQFNLYAKELQESLYVNFNVLNIALTKYIKTNRNREILTAPNTSNYYYIDNYDINTGDTLSRSNKMTNPLINFKLIPPLLDNGQEFLKFSVVIYKRGAVQLRLSYIDSKKIHKPLDLSMLQDLYSFLELLFTEIITKYEILTSEEAKIKKGITNMVDGRQPQTCHDRGGLRPVPYSFHGTCPDNSMFIRPEGKKRADGKYEPCCYKLKDNGKDSKSRYKQILTYGYPDSQAAKYDENIPNPDDKSAVFIPGTKIVESRRFAGLNNMSKDSLIKCIEKAGLIKEKTVFDNKDYNTLKNKVLNEYYVLSGTKNLINQHPITLTPSSFSLFTKDLYIVTPINNETIKVLLFFNNIGESYFINENYDISQSSLPVINDLSNTLIEGYLYPYENLLVFYPIDSLYLKNKDLSNLVFYSSASASRTSGKESRFNTLMYCLEKIRPFESEQLSINVDRFDLDIINGSKNYLTNTNMGDVSSLLFIPMSEKYMFNKTNKKLLIWNNINKESNNLLTLNVYNKSGNKWEVKIDSKNIPPTLLPLENNVIELPVVFTKNNNIVDGDLILFKININNVTNLINIRKPLLPLNKQEELIHDYFSVINILESINSPILKNTLINNNKGFIIQNQYYYHSTNQYGQIELNKPLLVSTV